MRGRYGRTRRGGTGLLPVLKGILAAFVAAATLMGVSGCAAKQERAVATRPLVNVLALGGSREKSAWKALASAYREQKNVRVRVKVVPAGQADSRLKSAMSDEVPPSLFVIKGPQGAQRWRDYLSDLGKSAAYSHLRNRQLALRNDGTVVALPINAESYGILYRKDVLKKYAGLISPESEKDRKNQKTDEDDSTLAALTDPANLLMTMTQVQSRKESLGLDEAAVSAWGTDQIVDLPLGCVLGTVNSSDAVRSLDGSDPHAQEQKRAQEQQNAQHSAQQLRAQQCINGLRTVATLIAQNDSGLLSRSPDDALAAFASGKAAFLAAGTDAWPQLQEEGLKAKDVGFLPVHFSAGEADSGSDPGAGSSASSDSSSSSGSGSAQSSASQSSSGAQKQKTAQQKPGALSGFISGSQEYWAINSQSSRVDQTATAAFVEWIATSEQGKKFAQRLGLWLPYSSPAGQKKQASGRASQKSGARQGADQKGNGSAQKDAAQGDAAQKSTTQKSAAQQGTAQEQANPLQEIVEKYWQQAADARKTNPDLMFKHQLAPTAKWGQDVRSVLEAYVETPSDEAWKAVENAFIDGWRTQYLTIEQ